jgi:hypothetical protein
MGRLSAGGPLSVSFRLGNSLALKGGQGRERRGRGNAGEGDASPARRCARRWARGLRQPATLSPWQRMAVQA